MVFSSMSICILRIVQTTTIYQLEHKSFYKWETESERCFLSEASYRFRVCSMSSMEMELVSWKVLSVKLSREAITRIEKEIKINKA